MLDEIKFLKPQFILLDGRTFAKAKSLIPKIKSTAGEGVYIYLFGLKLSEELKEKLKKTNNIYCYEKIPLLIENSILKNSEKLKNKDEEEKFELEPSNENSAVIIHADATIKKNAFKATENHNKQKSKPLLNVKYLIKEYKRSFQR